MYFMEEEPEAYKGLRIWLRSYNRAGMKTYTHPLPSKYIFPSHIVLSV